MRTASMEKTKAVCSTNKAFGIVEGYCHDKSLCSKTAYMAYSTKFIVKIGRLCFKHFMIIKDS